MSEGVRLYAGTQAALYLCIEHGGIVRRFDHGKSWEDVSKGVGESWQKLDIDLPANRVFWAAAD